jgi:hypothetical protein
MIRSTTLPSREVVKRSMVYMSQKANAIVGFPLLRHLRIILAQGALVPLLRYDRSTRVINQAL